jgi:hypothetical protein
MEIRVAAHRTVATLQQIWSPLSIAVLVVCTCTCTGVPVETERSTHITILTRNPNTLQTGVVSETLCSDNCV